MKTGMAAAGAIELLAAPLGGVLQQANHGGVPGGEADVARSGNRQEMTADASEHVASDADALVVGQNDDAADPLVAGKTPGVHGGDQRDGFPFPGRQVAGGARVERGA